VYNRRVNHTGLQMILRQIGNNQNLIRFNNGAEILFSYETPVAGYSMDEGYFRTEEYFSKTTSKHINNFVKDVNAKEVKQSFIEGLVNV
tara:strand:+ start:1216 stop:1482 length:267 start_codon:yes stop_codon:yes gene_type:complete